MTSTGVICPCLRAIGSFHLYYYAEPLYRDAAQMNTEDPAEVGELRAGFAQ